MSASKIVRFANGVALQLVNSRATGFVGIGDVKVGKVRLRDGQRPIRPRVDTPDGFLYTRLELAGIEAGPARAVVSLRAIGQPWAQQSYVDDYAQPLVNLDLPTDPVVDCLELVLEAVEETIGGERFAGFSYAWRFASDSRAIFRLMTLATWEIGGTIEGNTVLHQGQCNMPVYPGARDVLFTTACLKTLSAYGSPQGYSFQLCPRPGPLQGFDFQYSRAGVLVQYWPGFESVSSLVESPLGSTLLHVVDEQRFPLAREVTTPAKHVLFLPGERADHVCHDLWYAVYRQVYGGLRQRFGVAASIVRPEQNHGYSSRFENDQFKIVIHGQSFDPRDFLHAVADLVLPELARQGVKRFFPSVVSESDVTEVGLKRKLDAGIHGDLHCASVCATHRFFPAEFWGGIEGWRYLYRKGHALGLEVGAWFAPHYSPRSPVWKAHPDWAMIDATSSRAGGGYGFHTLTVADWNTGIYGWTLDNLKRWQDEGGLDFLFVDSYSNLGLLQQNFSAAMRTNFAPLSRLFADIQKLGIHSLCFESISAFGHAHFGLADLQGRYLAQDKSVAGQNDFAWWVGNEDMAVDISAMVEPYQRSGDELARILFRFMANRGYLVLAGLLDLTHQMPPWYASLNHTYNRVVDDMLVRRLLPDRAGVEWLGNDRRIIWSYAEQTLELEAGETVSLVAADGIVPLAANGTVPLHPYRVYRIDPVG